MDLQIIDKRIDTRPLADRLTQGESNADECMIVSERFYGAIDLAALTWEIRGTVRDRNLSMSQVLTPEDSEDQLRIPWKIGPEFLTTSGTLRLTLVGSGANGDVVVKFNGDKLYINPNDLSGFAPSTSPIEKMWAQMVAALETAKECAQQTARDAEAAKASEKNAASSAAAALASEQSSATSKQAAESAAKEAKEAAQEAVGFRTMQGGAVLPIDGDIDLTHPYPTKTGGSLTVTSAANRIDSVTINGFTTQTGSGDASPANIRKIENAGMYNAVVIVDLNKYPYSVTTSGFLNVVRVDVQNALQNMLFVEGSTVVFARSTWLPASKTISDNGDYPHFRTGSAAGSANGLVLYIPRSVLAGTTATDIKNYFAQNPLSVMYQSTDDTGKFYTGIEVEQGDNYHCYIVELQASLHKGDTLETNVQSEFDAELIVDGSKVVSVSQTSSGNYRINLNAPDDIPVPGAGVALNAESNYLLPTSANTLQSFDVKGVFCAYLSAIYIVLEDQTITTKELAQSYFNDNPLCIFYKSTSGGSPLNIKREEHVMKSYTLTGTENIQKSSGVSGNAYYINVSDAARLSSGGIVCNQAPTISQSDLFNSTDWGVSLSSSFNGIRISAPYDTVDALKAELATLYAGNTPFIVGYDLSQPEVYADTPIIIDNPQGTYTVSGESGTTCQVLMKRLQDGGDAATLNGHSWDNIVSLISEMINSKGE